MLHLHISNHTEKLLEILAAIIKREGRANLFAREIFLIQSPGVERTVCQYLADEFKSWCNFDFLLPAGLLRKIASSLYVDLETDLFASQTTVWRLEALLRDIDEDIYLPLKKYVSGEVAELKRYQLAGQIAQLFDQYQLMRPSMLARWRLGQRVTEEDCEIWQMHLWQRLVEEFPAARHQGEILENIIETLEKEECQRRLPRRIFVFGLHTMAPLFLKFLQALSSRTEVHLFLLSPCREYWGEVGRGGDRLLSLEGIRDSGVDLSSYEEEEPQQLLASLGRQGRDFQQMLVASAGYSIDSALYQGLGAGSPPSLLHVLQGDILERGRLAVTAARDDSLRIVSCHSPLRELAVLKDHILDLLYKDASLQLRDIVVMAPDIQEYAPLIPALFADIQYSIADRATGQRNTVMAVFLDYLNLFSGRFGWSEVLDLLRSEHIYSQFSLGEGDFDLLQKWVTESGIRWGLSAEQRQELGLPPLELNTWLAGLQRLLLGFAMSADTMVEGVLAYSDIEGNSAQALGGLCEFLQVLQGGQELYTTPRLLHEWAELLQGDAERLFGGEENSAHQELQQILAGLGRGREYQGVLLYSQPIAFQVVMAWLQQASAQVGSSAGFLRGQLTFCSMLPMRSIPFRVICLLGLNEGKFPKQDKQATFDLLASKPELGDRSPRIDDRYQFLEALISVRDSLYLSYVGRSIKNNGEIPPSVVLCELLDLLECKFAIKPEDIVVEQPLHPFSSKYFEGRADLFSYNENCLTLAQKIYGGGGGEERPWWSGNLGRPQENIYLADMVSFYKNPQRWFVSRSLEIRLGASSDLPDDTETFSASGLDRYLLEQGLVEDLLAGREVADIYHGLAIEGRWPQGTPGSLLFKKLLTELDEFTNSIRQIDPGPIIQTLPIDQRIGPYRLLGKVALRQNGIFLHRYANRKGKDLLEAWLYHLVAGRERPDIITWLVCKDGVLKFSEQPSEEMLLLYLEHFAFGVNTLSSFQVEAAYAYSLHCQKKSKKTPMQVAEETLKGSVTKGYEPELALAISGGVEEFLAGEFERYCIELMLPIWEYADEL
ncbi:exodeoxyribonuclease V subunit gamma [Desulfotalea psychrophila]|uniref:Related to exodeoxyribonuclease V, gamma chain n=1 Tax=Desulfotalea psychrophila (strain LSv54 / DSM 12343) TaxID=177439 RepID=Q6ANK2_DESPS|nr:exodeoxyribonuclease V subunit gamma [Desulfotalea psychrophila]CAG36072.1 related to exodeoxyribonuclease V, gamma chain [Desulfotalea psychrophila LSv54]